MNLYVNKQKAMAEATSRTLANAKKASLRTHSSGWRRVEYGVEKTLGIFWKVVVK